MIEIGKRYWHTVYGWCVVVNKVNSRENEHTGYMIDIEEDCIIYGQRHTTTSTENGHHYAVIGLTEEDYLYVEPVETRPELNIYRGPVQTIGDAHNQMLVDYEDYEDHEGDKVLLNGCEWPAWRVFVITLIFGGIVLLILLRIMGV